MLLACTVLFSALTLAFSALVGDNRYAGNSLNHRGAGGYSSGQHSLRGPASYGAPRAPAYGSHQAIPPAYGGGRHYGAGPARPSHYSAPAPYQAPAPYGGPSHVSGPSHYSSPKRSVYQPQPAHSTNSRLGGGHYSQPQQQASYQQQRAESKSQTHGREMKYTIRDPQNRGTTHVSETHVVSNRQMHGPEAEAAMKKLMGSMGTGPSYGSDAGFQDFIKDMGLPFY